MTIYITREGRVLGPYSLAQAQELFVSGQFHDNEWAWYKGRKDWIPLSQVPGFLDDPRPTRAEPVATVELPPPRRTALIWIISVIYIVGSVATLISAVLIPVIYGYADFNSSTVIYILIALSTIIGASLLFGLKKLALRFLGSALVASLILDFITLWPLADSMGLGVCWLAMVRSLQLAVVLYVWRLCKKQRLR